MPAVLVQLNDASGEGRYLASAGIYPGLASHFLVLVGGCGFIECAAADNDDPAVDQVILTTVADESLNMVDGGF